MLGTRDKTTNGSAMVRPNTPMPNIRRPCPPEWTPAAIIAPRKGAVHANDVMHRVTPMRNTGHTEANPDELPEAMTWVLVAEFIKNCGGRSSNMPNRDRAKTTNAKPNTRLSHGSLATPCIHFPSKPPRTRYEATIPPP